MQALLLITHVVVAIAAVIFSAAGMMIPRLAKRRIILVTNILSVFSGVIFAIYAGTGLAKVCLLGFALTIMTLLTELRLRRARQAEAL